MRLLYAFLLFLATLLPTQAEVCRHDVIAVWAHAFGKGTYPSQSSALRKEVAYVAKLAKRKPPPICEYKGDVYPVIHVAPTRRNLNVMRVLVVPDTMMRRFSPLAVRGTVAHEIAHLVRGHDPNWTQEQIDAEEIETDKHAAKWVGIEAVAAGLRAAGLLLETDKMPQRHREQHRAIVERRVQMLLAPR